MNCNNFIFILALILVLIFINLVRFENFDLDTNKYNTIIINHLNYKIIIVSNTNNNGEKKIYKIYKN